VTKHLPLRVVVVGPPLSASGGIGRVMHYTLSALAAQDFRLRVVDRRGLGSSPWSTFMPLLRTCGTNSIERHARRLTTEWHLTARRSPLRAEEPAELSTVET
jgi:hypothetical protein